MQLTLSLTETDTVQMCLIHSEFTSTPNIWKAIFKLT